jgi:hypothetical protein
MLVAGGGKGISGGLPSFTLASLSLSDVQLCTRRGLSDSIIILHANDSACDVMACASFNVDEFEFFHHVW